MWSTWHHPKSDRILKYTSTHFIVLIAFSIDWKGQGYKNEHKISNKRHAYITNLKTKKAKVQNLSIWKPPDLPTANPKTKDEGR